MSITAGLHDLRSLRGLTQLLVARGSTLAAGALIIALALDSALILSRALSGPQALPPAPTPSLSAAAPQNANPQVQLVTVLNAHLFGTAAGPGGNVDAPPTTMPLILAGVIADRDPAKGAAIIGQNAAAAKLYSVNAVITGGARLHAVYWDRVILERNGVLETLSLPRTTLGGAGVAPGSSAPAAPTAALNRDASLLAGLVRVQPVFSQGKLSGYRIFPGGANGTAAFNQLGLKAGDLIVAVNGTTLEDPARAMEVLQTLSSSGSASITVSRNGAAQEVNLDLATLSNLGSGADGGQGAAGVPPQPAPGLTPPRRRNGLPIQLRSSSAAGDSAGSDSAGAPVPRRGIVHRADSELVQ